MIQLIHIGLFWIWEIVNRTVVMFLTLNRIDVSPVIQIGICVGCLCFWIGIVWF